MAYRTFQYFAYNELQHPEVQTKLFGTELKQIPHTLEGYSAYRCSEQGFLYIQPNEDGVIDGHLLELNEEQLYVAERYGNHEIGNRESFLIEHPTDKYTSVDLIAYQKKNRDTDGDEAVDIDELYPYNQEIGVQKAEQFRQTLETSPEYQKVRKNQQEKILQETWAGGVRIGNIDAQSFDDESKNRMMNSEKVKLNAFYREGKRYGILTEDLEKAYKGGLDGKDYNYDLKKQFLTLYPNQVDGKRLSFEDAYALAYDIKGSVENKGENDLLESIDGSYFNIEGKGHLFIDNEQKTATFTRDNEGTDNVSYPKALVLASKQMREGNYPQKVHYNPHGVSAGEHTHCIVCNRPLRNALAQKRGVGSSCIKKMQ